MKNSLNKLLKIIMEKIDGLMNKSIKKSMNKSRKTKTKEIGYEELDHLFLYPIIEDGEFEIIK